MSEHRDVLIFGELVNGGLASITVELLGGGRRLADDLGESLSILLMGSGVDKVAKDAIACGADKVYVVDHSSITECSSDLYTDVVTKVCQQLLPTVFLLGQTDIGRDIAPRIAVRLNTALTTDCVALRFDAVTKLLIRTRPVYGGNALAEMVSASRPQMATVRAKSMAPALRDESRQGNIVPVKVEVAPSVVKSQLTNMVRDETAGQKLEEAEVIVCGGAGIGGAEGFNQLRELAGILKGAVGATRVPCHEGWVPLNLTIGQTGKVVNPELFISIGASGAVQHLAGCLGAKYIVAINKDPEANIFKVANFGIVADYKEALPSFIDECHKLVNR